MSSGLRHTKTYGCLPDGELRRSQQPSLHKVHNQQIRSRAALPPPRSPSAVEGSAREGCRRRQVSRADVSSKKSFCQAGRRAPKPMCALACVYTRARPMHARVHACVAHARTLAHVHVRTADACAHLYMRVSIHVRPMRGSRARLRVARLMRAQELATPPTRAAHGAAASSSGAAVAARLGYQSWCRLSPSRVPIQGVSAGWTVGGLSGWRALRSATPNTHSYWLSALRGHPAVAAIDSDQSRRGRTRRMSWPSSWPAGPPSRGRVFNTRCPAPEPWPRSALPPPPAPPPVLAIVCRISACSSGQLLVMWR
mmetsp:Transcript_14481/g.42184  ORF Transcript_14481/g.42184 Transcript_14481/m.42184 type:complete len:311 (-) Transcript_14481:986-1918(-)